MIEINRIGEWNAAARILGTGPGRIRGAIHNAITSEAHLFRREAVKGLRTQAPGGKKFKPLAKSTLVSRRMKGFSGSKALIVRGDLRNSIKVVVKTQSSGTEAFVGVLRKARSKNGKSLYDIAKLNEFGSRPIVIQITPAMAKFLAVLFKKMGSGKTSGLGGKGYIVIKIPARPFIRPIAEAHFSTQEAAERFQAKVARLLNYDFGTGSSISIGGFVG